LRAVFPVFASFPVFTLQLKIKKSIEKNPSSRAGVFSREIGEDHVWN
jgi:hypothetical protein